MPINLPHWDDLPLERPPVQEVIFQVRFAPLLSIAERLPTAFQEALRRRFPLFGVRQPLQASPGTTTIPLPQAIPAEFDLKTPDEKTWASLAINFVALTTREYSNWRVFRNDLALVLTAFEDVYKTALATRVGLRFVNLLDKDTTGLDTAEKLVSLLRRELTCLLRTPYWSAPEQAAITLLLEDGVERLSLRMGYQRKQEPGVILDFDYFIELEPPEERGREELLNLVDAFHSRVYDAFRWCIRESKLRVFKPRAEGER